MMEAFNQPNMKNEGDPGFWDMKRLAKNFLVFVVAVTLIAFLTLFLLCRPESPLGNICNIPDAVGVILSVIFGAITTALFYAMIEWRQAKFEKEQKNLKEELSRTLMDYARLYVVRTCLFNLKDIFAPPPIGRRKIKPSEHNRLHFLGILNERYLLKFEIREGDPVKAIYEKAIKHRIDDDHNFGDCKSCNEIAGEISHYLSIDGNPFEGGAEMEETDTLKG
jgi:hypothetical protein